MSEGVKKVGTELVLNNISLPGEEMKGSEDLYSAVCSFFLIFALVKLETKQYMLGNSVS